MVKLSSSSRARFYSAEGGIWEKPLPIPDKPLPLPNRCLRGLWLLLSGNCLRIENGFEYPVISQLKTDYVHIVQIR